MAVDRDIVTQVAHLARLEIKDAAIDEYVHNLSSILDLVDRLDQVDTQQVQPMAHPLDMKQRLRPDEVTEPNQRELFLQNAPNREAGLYLVNKVVE